MLSALCSCLALTGAGCKQKSTSTTAATQSSASSSSEIVLGEYGSMSVIRDPTGAVIALWKAKAA